jgi:hypothetical protein
MTSPLIVVPAVLFGPAVIALLVFAVRWILGSDETDAATEAPTTPPPVITVSGWYHIELQGRAGDLSGLVDEVVVAGAPFLRVREPDHCGDFDTDRLVTPKAIYRMTKVTESACRSEAVGRWYARPMGDVSVGAGEEARGAVELRRVGEAGADGEIESDRLAALPWQEPESAAHTDSGERDRPTMVETVSPPRMKSDRPTAVGIGEEVGHGG